MVYFEHEITAKNEITKNRRLGVHILWITISLFLFLLISHPNFKMSLTNLLIFGFVAGLGFWEMIRKYEYSNSEGKWHFYISDEKIYLQKPDNTTREILLDNISSVDYLSGASEGSEDYCYIVTKDQKVMSLLLPVINFYPSKVVKAFTDIGHEIREFRKDRRDYEREARRLGLELVDLVNSKDYLI